MLNTLNKNVIKRISFDGDCWMWTGYVTKTRRPSLTIDNKPCYVHILIYEQLVGELPDGHVLYPKCLRGLCVNPEHREPRLYSRKEADKVRYE